MLSVALKSHRRAGRSLIRDSYGFASARRICRFSRWSHRNYFPPHHREPEPKVIEAREEIEGVTPKALPAPEPDETTAIEP